VDPVPDPLLLRKNMVVPGIEPGSSGSVATNSDHLTTEAAMNETRRQKFRAESNSLKFSLVAVMKTASVV
jgi:hypothetical protein